MSRYLVHAATVALVVAMHPQAHAEYNTIGGDGGKPYNLQCPSGRYAVGMAARHDRANVVKPTEAIIQLRLKCVAVDPNTGNWSGTPAWTGWSPTDRLEGTQGLVYDPSTCPDNQFMSTRLSGNTTKVGFATVVGQLDWLCVRFDQVDPVAGTSRARVIDAQFGVGGTIVSETQRQHSRVVAASDSALNILYLKYGLALDSVKIGVRHMPWTVSPQALQRSSTLPRSRVSAGRVAASPAAPVSAQPDLSLHLSSTLWRYSGSTRHGNATYRKVHESFCASGMVRRGSYSTKSFYLPDVRVAVRNTGSAATPAGVGVQSRFGTNTRNFQAGALQPGQSQTFTLDRPSRVRRCVTLGRVPGGCHECAGQSAWQDPRLEVRVDTANAVRESDEDNNRLVQ